MRMEATAMPFIVKKWRINIICVTEVIHSNRRKYCYNKLTDTTIYSRWFSYHENILQVVKCR